ncbi:MerR family transcriptional regulator [Nocardiopsis sp. CNT-189]|uniref:MerR family transcriptional regulator n=1 Tax=Nocardiopsis oceanisediminis TaxID=2816862 RepID=UPI003B2D66D3
MLTIGEAARLLGTTPRTLRFYHERGVVPEPGRDELGHRRYDIGTVHTLKRVLALRELDLPLDRCAELLDADDEDLGTALREWEEEIARQQRELEQRRLMIARLRAEHDQSHQESAGPVWAGWAHVLAEHGVAPDLIDQERAAAQLLSLIVEEESSLRPPSPSPGGGAGPDGEGIGGVMARFVDLAHTDPGGAEADRLVEDLVELARPLMSAVPAPESAEAAGKLASGLLDSFPPAQRRVIREVMLRLGGEGEEGAGERPAP